MRRSQWRSATRWRANITVVYCGCQVRTCNIEEETETRTRKVPKQECHNVPIPRQDCQVDRQQIVNTNWQHLQSIVR